MLLLPPRSTLFPYTTLFRSHELHLFRLLLALQLLLNRVRDNGRQVDLPEQHLLHDDAAVARNPAEQREDLAGDLRSEEHTSELQSHSDLVCRLLLEKKKNID